MEGDDERFESSEPERKRPRFDFIGLAERQPIIQWLYGVTNQIEPNTHEIYTQNFHPHSNYIYDMYHPKPFKTGQHIDLLTFLNDEIETSERYDKYGSVIIAKNKRKGMIRIVFFFGNENSKQFVESTYPESLKIRRVIASFDNKPSKNQILAHTYLFKMYKKVTNTFRKGEIFEKRLSEKLKNIALKIKHRWPQSVSNLDGTYFEDENVKFLTELNFSNTFVQNNDLTIDNLIKNLVNHLKNLYNYVNLNYFGDINYFNIGAYSHPNGKFQFFFFNCIYSGNATLLDKSLEHVFVKHELLENINGYNDYVDPFLYLLLPQTNYGRIYFEKNVCFINGTAVMLPIRNALNDLWAFGITILMIIINNNYIVNGDNDKFISKITDLSTYKNNFHNQKNEIYKLIVDLGLDLYITKADSDYILLCMIIAFHFEEIRSKESPDSSQFNLYGSFYHSQNIKYLFNGKKLFYEKSFSLMQKIWLELIQKNPGAYFMQFHDLHEELESHLENQSIYIIQLLKQVLTIAPEERVRKPIGVGRKYSYISGNYYLDVKNNVIEMLNRFHENDNMSY
jgi:hypothetical protein